LTQASTLFKVSEVRVLMKWGVHIQGEPIRNLGNVLKRNTVS